jgi:polysaccharide chain length determinant protein (PEP-CTERM system associated)
LLDQLYSYLRSAWYYRWQATAIAWIVALAGWTVVYLMPNSYEANARVFVDTQSMLRPLLTGLAVQPNTDQVVAMMSRTLISRVNVEKLVQMAGMGSAQQTADGHEQLIARLTRGLAVRSAGQENLYTISYSDRDREQAKRVVQSLLTIFVEGSVGNKRRDSDSALQFIEEQLRNYSEKLVAAENAVTEFRRKHQGLMPGEGRDFFAALSEAKATHRRAALELKEAVNSRDAIKQQISAEARSAPQAQDMAAGPQAQSELDLRILALEQRLDGLRLTYTEQHPDIVSLVRVIEQLKEQKAAEEKQRKPAAGGVARTVARTPQGQPSFYDQLMVSLATAEANVAAMRARVAEYETRFSELQAAANALPQIDAEYKQLTRDYEVIRARYNLLLERREQAQISGAVEASDAGMGFRIIDPPQVPLAPNAPDRPRLMTLVLLAALGCGFGFAFLMTQLKVTFDDERKLREASGISVLGSVALALNDDQRRRRARGVFALALSYLSLLSAYGAIMASLILLGARA